MINMRLPEIITPFPLGFIPLCLLAGFLIAFALYYRERRSEISSRRRWVAATLRFLMYSMAAFLLMQPLIQSLRRDKEKALIAVLADNSQSIEMGKNQVPGWFSDLQNELNSLGSNYELKYYRFDEVVQEADSLDAKGYRSNISAGLEYVEGVLRNRNLGAVILASDGIYNAGADPLMMAGNLQAPVFTIALGDSTRYADARIARVESNRIAFLGNKFPVRIHTRTQSASGNTLRLQVQRDGRVLYSKSIVVGSDDHYSLDNIELEADRPGLNKYQISISPLASELNTANNRQNIYIEVLDSRKKVLMLAAAPHPDIGALKQAFEDRQQVEVELLYLPAAMPDLSTFDMAVLYQLPGLKQDARQWINSLRQASIPVLFCLGLQSDVRAFDALELGLRVAGPSAKYNDVSPSVNPKFNLFRPAEQTMALFPVLDPLQVPFGEFNAAADMQNLLFQRIGKLSTDKPLLSFYEQQGWKTAFITGEGVWRWRLAMFRESGTHQWFNDLMAMSLQYLAVSEKKGRFRVEWPGNILQSDQVISRAELYNASFQPEPGKEIRLDLRDPDGKTFNYIYSENGEAYALNLGYLQPGTYSYRASVKDVAGVSPISGSFEVEEVNVESMVLQADHRLLSSIAALRQAEILYPSEIDRLSDLIRAREDIKPLVYINRRYTDLAQWPAYLIIILMLLTAEWLIRRLSGAY
jgi:hypothetical protein